MIIQLKSEDASIKYDDSHWISNFQQTLVQPNQTVTLKNVFIDTRKNFDNSINIEEDISASIDLGFYISYNNSDFTALLEQLPNNTFFQEPNGRKYIIYESFQGNHPHSEINSVTYSWDKQGRGYGDFYLNFSYNLTKNNITTSYEESIYLPKQLPSKRQSATLFFSLLIDTNSINNILFSFKPNRVEPLQPFQTATNPITQENFTITQLPPSNGTIYPYVERIDFNIAEGIYTPLELVDIMNKQLQVILPYYTDITKPSNNKLLNTFSDFIVDANSAIVIIDDLARTGTNMTSLTQTSDIFIGTNEFSFTYDDDLQKFILQQAHMPIFDNTGNIIKKVFYGNAWQTSGQGVFLNREYKITSVYSGVWIYNLFNSVFWNDILGFNNEDLISDLTTVVLDATSFPGLYQYAAAKLTYPSNLKITDNFIGLDDLVVKNNSFYKAQDLTGIEIESNNLVSIPASNTYLSDLQSNAFFLIEVDLKGYNNDFIGDGQVFNKKIKGILSRYYSIENYTTGGVECDIQFTNTTTTPILLSSAEIRILDSSFNLADTGDDNTIILEII